MKTHGKYHICVSVFDIMDEKCLRFFSVLKIMAKSTLLYNCSIEQFNNIIIILWKWKMVYLFELSTVCTCAHMKAFFANNNTNWMFPRISHEINTRLCVIQIKVAYSSQNEKRFFNAKFRSTRVN